MQLYQNFWLKNSDKAPDEFSFKNNKYVREWIEYEKVILRKSVRSFLKYHLK